MNKSLSLIVAAVICIGVAHTEEPAPTVKPVLMVVTSADKIDDQHPTGVWLDEYVVPVNVITRAGFTVVTVSPKGGIAPVDPRSVSNPAQKQQAGVPTAPPTAKLDGNIKAENYSGVFICGGHGAIIDLFNDAELKRVLSEFNAQQKPIAAVCHGPAGLIGAKDADGAELVAGKKMTAFSDAEEREVKLDQAVPFLLEDNLRKAGAQVSTTRNNFEAYVVEDGNLITGQNPASSQGTAEALVAKIRAVKK